MENNQEILEKIKSGDEALTAEAIKEVQQNGDLSIARDLLQYTEQIEDGHLMTLVISLLADIKDSSFREILIEKIRTTADTRLKSELLRIVWESALNYSAYLDFFTDLLCHEDFSVAFEASTVIENMVHLLSPEQIRQLHSTIDAFPADKQFLIENIHEELRFYEED